MWDMKDERERERLQEERKFTHTICASKVWLRRLAFTTRRLLIVFEGEIS